MKGHNARVQQTASTVTFQARVAVKWEPVATACGFPSWFELTPEQRGHIALFAAEIVDPEKVRLEGMLKKLDFGLDAIEVAKGAANG